MRSRQTASAEYHTNTSSGAVQLWYVQHMPLCGWQQYESWDGNAGTFPHGVGFSRGSGNDLTVTIGFDDIPDRSTDVGIAAGAVRYPPPPARARIHGPFLQLRVSLAEHSQIQPGALPTHAIITDRNVIARLVRAIDKIGAAFKVGPICHGPVGGLGAAWLTFVRPDGSKVHAFKRGPGECGGLAVNGFRWLLDRGAVWSQIQLLAGKGGSSR